MSESQPFSSEPLEDDLIIPEDPPERASEDSMPPIAPGMVGTEPIQPEPPPRPAPPPPPPPPPPPVIGVGFLMAWGGLALGMVAVVAAWKDALIDDAFIAFRYAQNSAAGLGLVFNPGERVEGFTSLLWTLLARYGFQLEADVPHTAQFISVLCNLGLMVVTYLFARRKLNHSPFVALIAPMLLLANLHVAAWAAHGMETSLFALLVTFGLMMAAPEEDGSLLARDTAVGAGILLAAAALTRPEGVLYILLALGFNGLRAIRAGRGGSALVLLALSSLAPVALLFAWRYSYYGEWLPNTYYAKATGGAGRLETGLRYLLNFFDTSLLQGIVLVPLVALLRRVPKGPRPLFFAVTLATALYCLAVGGDAFQGARFLVPILPVFYLLVQDGLNTFFRSWRPLRVMTVAFVLLIGLQTVIATGDVAASQAGMAESMTRNRSYLGKMLGMLIPPEYTVALNTVGALPYYSQHVTLDLYGLTNAHIARQPIKPGPLSDPGHEKGDGAYVLAQKPDLILLRNVWLADVPIEDHRALYGTSERELMANPAFLEEYVPVNLRLRDDLLFGFYLRKDHSVDALQTRFRDLSLTSFGVLEELSSERGMERVLFDSGQRLMQAGRPEAAVREYQRALSLYPDGGEVRLALAQALEALNQLEEAREQYTRATELLTESGMAWLGVGNVEAKLEHPEQAIRAYQRAIVADPNAVDAYANLASQLLKEGRNADAIPVLRLGLNRAPRDIELWIKMGGAAGMAQRWADAREALERATNIAPDDPRTVKLREYLMTRLPPDMRPEALRQ